MVYCGGAATDHASNGLRLASEGQIEGIGSAPHLVAKDACKMALRRMATLGFARPNMWARSME